MENFALMRTLIEKAAPELSFRFQLSAVPCARRRAVRRALELVALVLHVAQCSGSALVLACLLPLELRVAVQGRSASAIS